MDVRPNPSASGQRLGRYPLLGEIASGGMARVHVGRMLGKGGFQRTIAIKVLHRHLAQEPSFVAMFLDEARLAAQIHHPNVVQVLDVDALDGVLFLVMEFVEGVTLADLAAEAKRRGELLPIGLVGRALLDSLEGLHAAHELRDSHGQHLGLVHRDMSPQNILVGADGITRVTDFGVAKAAGRIATTGSKDIVKGKLRYLAPEQVSLEDLDRRADLFSTGIVLWEALTGSQLFGASSEAQALAMLLTCPIAPPSTVRPEVPLALDEVCMKALERQRSQRFSSAAEFGEALERAVGGGIFRPKDCAKYVRELSAARIQQVRERIGSSHSIEAPTEEEALREVFSPPEGNPVPEEPLSHDRPPAAALKPRPSTNGFGARRAVVMGLALASAVAGGSAAIAFRGSAKEAETPAEPRNPVHTTTTTASAVQGLEVTPLFTSGSNVAVVTPSEMTPTNASSSAQNQASSAIPNLGAPSGGPPKRPKTPPKVDGTKVMKF